MLFVALNCSEAGPAVLGIGPRSFALNPPAASCLLMFELDRRTIPERRVETLAILDAFDERSNLAASVSQIRILRTIHQLTDLLLKLRFAAVASILLPCPENAFCRVLPQFPPPAVKQVRFDLQLTSYVSRRFTRIQFFDGRQFELASEHSA